MRWFDCFSMVGMLKWVGDVGLAVLLSGLEVAALAAFLFVLELEKWAAKGEPAPDRTGRIFLGLSLGATALALISHGLSRADLPVACTAQAVVAALLVVLLLLRAGTGCGRWAGGFRRRRRLRRERLGR